MKGEPVPMYIKSLLNSLVLTLLFSGEVGSD
jgi:hypothetical protein